MTVYCGVAFRARQQTVCRCDTADGVISPSWITKRIMSAASIQLPDERLGEIGPESTEVTLARPAKERRGAGEPP
jgi:hypothetical protein